MILLGIIRVAFVLAQSRVYLIFNMVSKHGMFNGVTISM